MSLIVTVLDTTGIQPYIFGSNRLRENVGASYLVSQVTDEWVKKVLEDLKKNQNWNIQIPAQPEDKPHIEDGELTAELVYAGGGNTVLLFQTIDYAKEFTRKLSRKILEEAPGINLVAAHKEFEWNSKSDPLYQVIQNVMKNEVDRAKQQRVPSAPLLGLGVTADCRSSRLVAVSISNEEQYKMPSEHQAYPISREIGAKLVAVNAANDQLKYFIFDRETSHNYKIPLDVDDMGRSEGESSYIAIVHADGNNMGKRFQDVGIGKSNREYITEIRKLSHSIQEAGKNALKKVYETVVKSLDSGSLAEKISLKDNTLPFRPIVYGGDDVTFVCDGRLGLELAAIYLQAFEEQSVSYGDKLTACAGVCIVKSHYPFARAYKLSEDLCGSAKKYAKSKAKEKTGQELDFSAIDWHLAASGLIGSVSEIREREYQISKDKLLYMRPVLITQDDEWRTWQGITKVIEELNNNLRWKDKRNKVIALREILRKGSRATEEYLKAYGLGDLPYFASRSTVQLNALARSGWTDELDKRICGYFDAIEAMEFYVSLTEDTNEQV
jgi:hypothetical protein